MDAWPEFHYSCINHVSICVNTSIQLFCGDSRVFSLRSHLENLCFNPIIWVCCLSYFQGRFIIQLIISYGSAAWMITALVKDYDIVITAGNCKQIRYNQLNVNKKMSSILCIIQFRCDDIFGFIIMSKVANDCFCFRWVRFSWQLG